MMVRLPLSLHTDLKAEAEARGLTVAALLRVILHEALGKKYREREKK